MSTLQLGSQGLSSEGDGLKIWSCTNCRRRKVRCNRRHPCEHCTKNKADCVFPVSGRLPRRSQNPAAPGNQPTRSQSQRNAELLARLRKLEAMVADLSNQVENATVGGGPSRGDDKTTEVAVPHSESNAGSSSSWSTDATGQLDLLATAEENCSVVVGDRFWSALCAEVEHIYAALRDPKGHDWANMLDSHHLPERGAERISYYRYLTQSSGVEKLPVPPLPSEMTILWDSYVQRVNPFSRILHIPSMASLIRGTQGRFRSLGPALQSLIYAVSFSGVSVLEDKDVRCSCPARAPNSSIRKHRAIWNQLTPYLISYQPVFSAYMSADKDQLTARYRQGAEKCFAAADFLNTNDITVLQAFTIYLHALQHQGEGSTVWPLIGTLTRIAVRLRLHRDPANFPHDFTTFEIESRRRLWWGICHIDADSWALSSNCTIVDRFLISEGMYDTSMPLNVDDSDIDLGSREEIPAREGRTDMTIYLTRCHFWKMSRQVQTLLRSGDDTFSAPTKDAMQWFRESRDHIEKTCLRQLDLHTSIDSFFFTTARLYFNRTELLLIYREHESKTGGTSRPPEMSSETSDLVLDCCLSILESRYALLHEPQWMAWRWILKGHGEPPFRFLHDILDQLCRRPAWDSRCEEALSVARRAFDEIPNHRKKGTLYHRLSTLMVAATRRKPAERIGDGTIRSTSTLQEWEASECVSSMAGRPTGPAAHQVSRSMASDVNGPSAVPPSDPHEDVGETAYNGRPDQSRESDEDIADHHLPGDFRTYRVDWQEPLGIDYEADLWWDPEGWGSLEPLGGLGEVQTHHTGLSQGGST